jgi:hypothetical protein
MTWLAWRQLRIQVLVVAGLVVALVAFLATTGPHLLHVYDSVVAPCAVHHDCGSVTPSFLSLAHLSSPLSTLVTAVPILIGVFWGAPLVARELESGTFRLAWTQSVTRVRWIAVRLLLAVVAAVVVTGLISLAVTWWQSPVDRLYGLPYGNFDARDLVPAAYTAFAVALGALLGAIVKRTLAAMAATIVGFAVVRYLIAQYVRSHLFAPLRSSTPLRASVTLSGSSTAINPPSAGAWTLSNLTETPSGRVVGQLGGVGPDGGVGFNVKHDGAMVLNGVGPCPNRFPTPSGGLRPPHTSPSQAHAAVAAMNHCLQSFDLRSVLTYQPQSRYWPLQWSEAGIFLALAAALGAACVWWVRRRLP